MTTLLVDDAPVSLPAGATVGDVIRQIRAVLASDRLITEVRVDGVTVVNEALDEALARSTAEVGELAIHSEAAVPMVLSILRTARAGVTDLQATRERSADLLVAGDSAQGTRLIGDLVRSWSESVTAIDGCAELLGVGQRGPDAPIAAATAELRQRGWVGPDVDAALAQVQRALNDLRDALTENDPVRLGDQMRYELDQSLDAWQGLIGRFIESLEQHA